MTASASAASSAAASSAAATAAARQRAMLEEEEERMTPYTPDELNQDWEFKIMRANRRIFQKPENLARLLEEEGRAGWTLVEKFDDARVRLKRPRNARANDPQLPAGCDPYRTYVGMSPTKWGVLVVLITIACVVAALGTTIALLIVLG